MSLLFIMAGVMIYVHFKAPKQHSRLCNWQGEALLRDALHPTLAAALLLCPELSSCRQPHLIAFTPGMCCSGVSDAASLFVIFRF